MPFDAYLKTPVGIMQALQTCSLIVIALCSIIIMLRVCVQRRAPEQ